MLKHRLVAGTLMTLLFAGLLILDGWLDGSLMSAAGDDKPAKGLLLTILLALLIIAAQFEFAKLAAAKGVKVFTSVTAVASILFATSWYWGQFIKLPQRECLLLLAVFSLCALLLAQRLTCGVSAVLANCGVSCFSIFYLGILPAFVPAIRIDCGLWQTLMFVFVVKCADVGAYTAGTLWGRHQFSPKISPRKTWEGMVGAIVAAAVIALLFAAVFDIMPLYLALVFGICFAFLGQLGDLAESMMKRDAEQKDSAHSIPGFGGLLDVVDSPLLAAPFAYLFFMVIAR